MYMHKDLDAVDLGGIILFTQVGDLHLTADYLVPGGKQIDSNSKPYNLVKCVLFYLPYVKHVIFV